MVEVRVWGDFACFTRPENKAERVTYDIMTPSAARGVLEAIFWKPEFQWRIREIWVLKPIQHLSILRNEVGNAQSIQSAYSWQESGEHYYADNDRTRVQRHSLVLRDVEYLIRAEMQLKPHASDPVFKYQDQFRRRIKRGQCHHTPYLGTREFSAYFAPPDGSEKPITRSDDLGRILFDITYVAEEGGPVIFRQHDTDGARWIEGRARPVFFSAQLDRGVLHVPLELYEEMN